MLDACAMRLEGEQQRRAAKFCLAKFVASPTSVQGVEGNESRHAVAESEKANGCRLASLERKRKCAENSVAPPSEAPIHQTRRAKYAGAANSFTEKIAIISGRNENELTEQTKGRGDSGRASDAALLRLQQ